MKWIAVAAALTGLTLAGCSSTPQAASRDPQQVLTQAANTLGTTSGVKLTLNTTGLPSGVNGLVDATGTATRAPAFDGTIKVVVSGAAVEVPVISVDNTVHAKLPLTTGWSTINPAEYNAFDPAILIDPAKGLPSLLTDLTGAARGEQRRGGPDNSEVLTEYTGTVPAASMQRVIPSAGGDSFATTVAVTDGDQVREASFTGQFYPGAGATTYRLSATDYGLTATITAP